MVAPEQRKTSHLVSLYFLNFWTNPGTDSVYCLAERDEHTITFFGVKSRFFTRNTPKNVRASLRSAQFFLRAPP